MGERIESGLYQSCMNMGKVGYVCVFGCGGDGWLSLVWEGGVVLCLDPLC